MRSHAFALLYCSLDIETTTWETLFHWTLNADLYRETEEFPVAHRSIFLPGAPAGNPAEARAKGDESGKLLKLKELVEKQIVKANLSFETGKYLPRWRLFILREIASDLDDILCRFVTIHPGPKGGSRHPWRRSHEPFPGA